MTPTMDLKETIDLMTSENAEDRFRAEYYQLEARFIALNEMLIKWDLGKLDNKPKTPRLVFNSQLGSMRSYMNTLQERAKTEGIEL